MIKGLPVRKLPLHVDSRVAIVLTKLIALGRMDKLKSHADNMASLLEMKNRGNRSRSRERGHSVEPKSGGA